MKITTNTPQRLVLRHRRVVRPFFTGFFALLFFAMAYFAHADAPGITYGFILSGAMLVFAMVVFDLQRSEVVFSRPNGTVRIRHSILGRGKTQVIQLGSVKGAFLRISGTNAQVTGTTMDGGQKCPALEMKRGKAVPLCAIANFSKSHQAAVDAVNNWLGFKGGEG